MAFICSVAVTFSLVTVSYSNVIESFGKGFESVVSQQYSPINSIQRVCVGDGLHDFTMKGLLRTLASLLYLPVNSDL